VSTDPHRTSEHARLASSDTLDFPGWRDWGPFVSERAWGSVREDYSADGDAWNNVTHDMARSHAYRWGEDGLASVCDRRQGMCLGLALWNGQDPILKERLFGLTNSEGNHGEDAKEYWWYVDATPTHSWLSWRYHYPLDTYPYADLVAENARRGQDQREYELVDTGVFEQGYWAVTVDYAKADSHDLCMRIRARNTSTERATLHLLPTWWVRNVWGWNAEYPRSELRAASDPTAIAVDHYRLGRWVAASSGPGGPADRLFCENETNTERLYGSPNATPFPKDGINDHVVAGAPTVNPDGVGTKASWWHRLEADPDEVVEVRVRLQRVAEYVAGPEVRGPLAATTAPDLGASFEAAMADRRAEADEFYATVIPPTAPPADRLVARQAFAGLLWSQQFYRYDVQAWLDGDPDRVPPPPGRGEIRNGEWTHVKANDVIVMPDKWEYPWFASWDLAFHCVALAHVDPELAKDQLLLLTREWYQHANGALPAYEWNFSDVNPPVQAWATMRVFEIDGGRDHTFLARMFNKLVLNFTWWVNRQDADGNNVFEGGFLGLDNIGPFNRSQPLPEGAWIEQSDGTAWMAKYCLDMLDVALVLARHDRAYEDMAVKFLEHFALISRAMNDRGLWDDDDGFYYDLARLPDGTTQPLRVRSMVGVIPLFALATESADELTQLGEFHRRARSFFEHYPEYASTVARIDDEAGSRVVISLGGIDQIRMVGRRLFDEERFLSPHGLRSLSRWHLEHPVTVQLGPVSSEVSYAPGESTSRLFGGNSNWRGPVWFPVNFLVIESIRRLARFLGEGLEVRYPFGSGRKVGLDAVADDLSRRLVSLFVPGEDGLRPCEGGSRVFPDDPACADLIWFHEFFHGDTGEGLGASHQTGWTALVADLVVSLARRGTA
jgi:hypothetical protein